jgi:hypothetical protein
MRGFMSLWEHKFVLGIAASGGFAVLVLWKAQNPKIPAGLPLDAIRGMSAIVRKK